MFGLFKSKGEKPEEKERKPLSEGTKNSQFKEFAAQFQPEELSILAVTGPNGFSGAKAGQDDLWQLSTGLTAWMEEDSPDIHREETELVSLGDERLLGFLRQRTHPDFIIKFRGRASADGRRILLLDLPEPGFDPDLKAILEEQKKPVTLWADGLGTFTLDRRVKWFAAEVDWLGTQVSLSFDQEDEEKMKKSQTTARALLAGAEDWDRRVRERAADKLLELANDWSQDMDEDGQAAEVTREQFIQRMELEAIEVRADGSFQFWFGDGELFCGHSIWVSGGLENGPDEANMEG